MLKILFDKESFKFYEIWLFWIYNFLIRLGTFFQFPQK